MSFSVNISVEAPIENQIQEITYDGQEIYQAPLSLSESLAKFAQKIDWSRACDATTASNSADIKGFGITDSQQEAQGSSSIAVDDSKDTFPPHQSQLWPWDGVRSKLRSSLQEVCVLADVLAIAKEKKYMVLDPVQQEGQDTKPMVQIYARKKALAGAAHVLLTGAERLKTSQNEVVRNRSDFHFELLRLRQNWRLKKVSNSIIGDLSYRTAGSKFGQTGMFEVCKAEETDSPGSASDNPSIVGTASGAAANSSASALKVAVPSELQGVAYIEVLCQKDQEELFSYTAQLSANAQSSLNQNNSSGNSGNAANSGQSGSNAQQQQPAEVHWQQKLEAAQNVLFCKELFNQLAREAVQQAAQSGHGQGISGGGSSGGSSNTSASSSSSGPPIPHLVVGNQIMATVLPGIQLIIGLCHSGGGLSPSSTSTSSTAATQALASSTPAPPVPAKTDHDHVLEHSLHQLLREVHHRNTHHPLPHPATGPLGPSKRRRLAGPTAADRHDLLQMSRDDPLLHQIIRQAQHFFMRMRTEYVLDTIAREVKDPLIASHWNTANSPTQAAVKINIATHGYDAVFRTPLVLQVRERGLRCVCRDGKVMVLSYEPQELRDLLLTHLHQHQVLAVQALARTMGWQLLGNSTALGLGSVEPLGNAGACLIASPAGDRLVAVRCEAATTTNCQATVNIHVSVAHSPRQDFFPSRLVHERKWEHLGGQFRDVRLDRMEGRNFLHKMELLMASLTSSS